MFEAHGCCCSSYCMMQYCLVQGERLSHAVGCAFAACLERKQKREKECGVTATFDASRTTFTREGSFRVTTATEQAEREEIMRQMPDAKGTGCNLHSHPQWAEQALRCSRAPARTGLNIHPHKIPSLELGYVQIIFPDTCHFARWKVLPVSVLGRFSLFAQEKSARGFICISDWTKLLLLCFVCLLYGRGHHRHCTKGPY